MVFSMHSVISLLFFIIIVAINFKLRDKLSFLLANFICGFISVLLFLQDPTLFDTFLVVVVFSNISFYYFPTGETTLLNKFQFLVLVTNACSLTCFLIAMFYDSYFLGQEIDKHTDSPIFWLIDLLIHLV
jgi:hypothetical protein